MKFDNLFENLEELAEKTNSLDNDKIIVYTYGAWDLLHPGHIIFLRKAKDLGDFLVVGVVDDPSIRELKGDDRPVQGLESRLINISSIRYIDAAIKQNTYDPSSVLEKVGRVAILTKGDDWEYIPGEETIRKLGGKLVKLSYTSAFSTTKIFKRINDSGV